MIRVVRQQGDELVCICPLHNDSNASLYINPKRNLAICFAGCYEGNAVDLISKIEKLPRFIAYKQLVSKEVFYLDKDFVSSKNGNGHSSETYSGDEKIIWLPGDTTDYLTNRGFSRGTIRYWDIDFCDTLKYIRIPIVTKDKQIHAYTYRTIKKGIDPKYLHPGFNKKQGVLFGENNFEFCNSIVNVVEGPLDLIWLWQNGYSNTLAFLGTPSEKQIERLLLFGNKFRLCLDNDEGGEKARNKVLELLKNKGIKNIWSIKIPDNYKDVQEIKKEELMLVMKSIKEDFNNG